MQASGWLRNPHLEDGRVCRGGWVGASQVCAIAGPVGCRQVPSSGHLPASSGRGDPLSHRSTLEVVGSWLRDLCKAQHMLPQTCVLTIRVARGTAIQTSSGGPWGRGAWPDRHQAEPPNMMTVVASEGVVTNYLPACAPPQPHSCPSPSPSTTSCPTWVRVSSFLTYPWASFLQSPVFHTS